MRFNVRGERLPTAALKDASAKPPPRRGNPLQRPVGRADGSKGTLAKSKPEQSVSRARQATVITSFYR